ncbi:MAG: hypothetical protein CMF48_01590 [Legionellales bacterium]|nr:hypothetical protein [Legionellales bacterium]|tara:strand:- start:4358 stop:4798 length:441 start_codon:yes stop_codon:yes gene_type:complete
MKSLSRWVVGLSLALASTVVAAATLKSAADGIYAPVAFLTVLMHYASYAVGGLLLIGAILQYRIHRQNPKLTPLMTPVVMVIIGICAIFLPFFANVFGNSWSAENQNKTGNKGDVKRIESPNKPHWSSGSNQNAAGETQRHWSDGI